MTGEGRGPIECPRCGKTVEPDQDWCLNCGAASRTKLISAPHWRRPVAILGVLVLVSIVAFAVAFVDLTRDPAPPHVAPVETIKTVTAPVTPTTTTP